MTERIQHITQHIELSSEEEVIKAIRHAEAMEDLTADEKVELARALSDIFYFHDHSGITTMAKLAVRAEQLIAGFGCDVVPFLIEELVNADAESAAYFGKAIALNTCPDVQVLLDAWQDHDEDEFAIINIIQAISYYRNGDGIKALPQLLVSSKSQNYQVRAISLYSIGKLCQRIKKNDLGAEKQLHVYDTLFEKLLDPKPIVRQQAVHALGVMQQKGLLTDLQRSTVLAAFKSILGTDNRHKWDRAYIVRNEAARFLPYFSSTVRLGDKYRQTYKILSKRELCLNTFHYEIEAPLIAGRLKAGQFVIVRPHDHSERIPLSVCGWDRHDGTIYIIVNTVGKTSREINSMEVGDSFTDIVGPLGERSHIQKYDNTCVVIGGGYGTGAIIPTAKDLRELGNRVIGIVGARQEDLLIMTEELADVCDEVIVTTNDGSKGVKGFVTDALKQIIDREKVSSVLAIGPVPMMKAVSELTKPHKIDCFVSLNAIMVDGTGMCGACRVSVGGKTRFACFHGPDFDGHAVDFEQLSKRQGMFKKEEAMALEGAKS